ncbi:MAG: class I SAM-dependent methyltransferase [Methyloceanibacter sp.]
MQEAVPISNGESRRRVRLYLRLRDLIELLPMHIQSIHGAFWLGVLDADDLNAVTMASYAGDSGFQEADHNFLGLSDWELQPINRFFKPGQSIMIAGVGGGREAIALAKQGFCVTAFDCSEALVTACRTNLANANLQARVLIAPPDGLPDELEYYDGLIVGRGVYHHIPGRWRRVQFLRQSGRHLKPGAPIFISSFFAQPHRTRAFKIIRAIAQLVRWARLSSDPVEIGDWLTLAYQHRFVRDEIEGELTGAGFVPTYYAESIGSDFPLAHAIGLWNGLAVRVLQSDTRASSC